MNLLKICFFAGFNLIPLLLIVLTLGCTTTDQNQFWYGNPAGFTPHAVTRHAPQAIWSNLPYDRSVRLTQQISQVTPQRWMPTSVMVGPNSCGLCTSGEVIYVDPGFVYSFSDEELLGALAHEMAHGDLGHIGRSQLAGVLVTLAFRAVKGDRVGSRTMRVHDITKALTVAQFSQNQEKEADKQAVLYLDALGYEGSTILVGMFSKLQAMGFNQWPSWFASHPSIPQRIASIQLLSPINSVAQQLGDRGVSADSAEGIAVVQANAQSMADEIKAYLQKHPDATEYKGIKINQVKLGSPIIRKRRCPIDQKVYENILFCPKHNIIMGTIWDEPAQQGAPRSTHGATEEGK